MTLHRDNCGRTLRITKVTKAEKPATAGLEHRAKAAQPARTIGERNVNNHQFTDLATLSFRERTTKAEAPRAVGPSDEAIAFAKRTKVSDDAVHVFATLATTYEQTGVAPFDDSHEIAKATGLSDEQARAAKADLCRTGLLRIRCNDSWGRDTLVPCRTFSDRGGRW